MVCPAASLTWTTSVAMNRLHLMRKVKNIIDLGGGGEKQSGEPRIASMIKVSRTAGYKKPPYRAAFLYQGVNPCGTFEVPARTSRPPAAYESVPQQRHQPLFFLLREHTGIRALFAVLTAFAVPHMLVLPRFLPATGTAGQSGEGTRLVGR